MGSAVKHPVPDRVKPSFVIFDNPGTLTLSPDALQLYPYGNSGRQRVNTVTYTLTMLSCIFRLYFTSVI